MLSARTGSLRLAADDEERDELRAEYEALRDDGFAAEWLDDLPEPPRRARSRAAILHPGRRGAPACTASSGGSRSRCRGWR